MNMRVVEIDSQDCTRWELARVREALKEKKRPLQVSCEQQSRQAEQCYPLFPFVLAAAPLVHNVCVVQIGYR